MISHKSPNRGGERLVPGIRIDAIFYRTAILEDFFCNMKGSMHSVMVASSLLDQYGHIYIPSGTGNLDVTSETTKLPKKFLKT